MILADGVRRRVLDYSPDGVRRTFGHRGNGGHKHREAVLVSRVGLRFSPEEYAVIRSYAAQKGLTPSELLREAIQYVSSLDTERVVQVLNQSSVSFKKRSVVVTVMVSISTRKELERRAAEAGVYKSDFVRVAAFLLATIKDDNQLPHRGRMVDIDATVEMISRNGKLLDAISSWIMGRLSHTRYLTSRMDADSKAMYNVAVDAMLRSPRKKLIMAKHFFYIFKLIFDEYRERGVTKGMDKAERDLRDMANAIIKIAKEIGEEVEPEVLQAAGVAPNAPLALVKSRTTLTKPNLRRIRAALKAYATLVRQRADAVSWGKLTAVDEVIHKFEDVEKLVNEIATRQGTTISELAVNDPNFIPIYQKMNTIREYLDSIKKAIDSGRTDLSSIVKPMLVDIMA